MGCAEGFQIQRGWIHTNITEPWTGKHFWDVQVHCLICFIWKLPDTSKDVIAEQCKANLHWTVRRQVQTLDIWHWKRVPCHGEDLKPPGKNQERRGGWGCSCCWVAPSGTFRTLLSDPKLILPSEQVKDSPKDQARSGWVNFKQAVWHESFYKLLELIEAYSATGCWVKCGDGVNRHVYPLILILAADYKEQ